MHAHGPFAEPLKCPILHARRPVLLLLMMFVALAETVAQRYPTEYSTGGALSHRL